MSVRRISPAKAKVRASIAGMRYAVSAGKRAADDPALRDNYRELAVITVEEDAETLAAKAAKLIADWPDLTPDQLGRIASVLRGGANG